MVKIAVHHQRRSHCALDKFNSVTLRISFRIFFWASAPVCITDIVNPAAKHDITLIIDTCRINSRKTGGDGTNFREPVTQNSVKLSFVDSCGDSYSQISPCRAASQIEAVRISAERSSMMLYPLYGFCRGTLLNIIKVCFTGGKGVFHTCHEISVFGKKPAMCCRIVTAAGDPPSAVYPKKHRCVFLLRVFRQPDGKSILVPFIIQI